MRAAAGSDIGRRYPANFDVVHLGADPLVAVVADGMGAGAGSAAAGRTAVDLFVAGIAGAPTGSAPDAARAAVAAAQARVGEIGARLRELAGCTLAAMVEAGGGYWLVQIGDSRVYRLRGELLELLTVDHTMAWLGAVHGWFPFDSEQAARARYQLTRYIGHPDAPEPDVLNLSVRPGDVYLLCTDGITDQVPYGVLREVLGEVGDPQRAVDRLIAAASAAGGSDNATAIVVVAESV
ncbi:protein phosphatase 2C domain-containing protein [Nocardia puris]|uniref:PP2C family protein-serine/threonine phosphatase n=1 Tax=Nocardia puris TaxID=208602 RepID=UPI0018930427|nr:protein phosphatase 2C domain-containing protein [Nocardia puris]MBF6211294.1 protein phosphatase 2C domain-containing protein [Nocardia puris]MBF6365013.1 protein phosphatase 2C domain-containing protein [Nocardia puris]MBF6458798.1 protein phosphatase 2C domain-containing protein [Nocardia puris]